MHNSVWQSKVFCFYLVFTFTVLLMMLFCEIGSIVFDKQAHAFKLNTQWRFPRTALLRITDPPNENIFNYALKLGGSLFSERFSLFFLLLCSLKSYIDSVREKMLRCVGEWKLSFRIVRDQTSFSTKRWSNWRTINRRFFVGSLLQKKTLQTAPPKWCNYWTFVTFLRSDHSSTARTFLGFCWL